MKPYYQGELRMRVLIACEFSQVVCKAFRERGHEAYSCDILPCEGGHPEWHIQDDVLKHLDDGWDMMIAHPPCTYLSYAAVGVWNDNGRVYKRLEALKFFADLWTAPVERICIENPRGCASPTIAKYTQEIQPYYWGDAESKTTWLWLKSLPMLEYKPYNPMFNDGTEVKPKIYGYYKRGKKKGQPIYGNCYLKPSENRGKIRSVFWASVAEAMAEQWG